MRSKAYLLFLLPGALCAGQSVLTTPVGVTQSAPASAPAPGTAQAPRQGETLAGGDFNSGAIAPTAASPTTEAATPAQLSNPGRVVGPLTTKSEFEQFAEDATGRRLPVYGRRLFDEVPTTFAPVEDVPVPADYVLGPGDQLLIRAWGKIDLDSRVTVDRNGQINLPRVGTLTVSGLRYAQIEGYLHSAIGALFKDFELNVALGKLRSMQIYVLGDARRPGVYTVSSLSTLVDALFASGGPSATGTMRHILLRREGRTIADFDIYDLIEKGDKSGDARLLPGDIIFIPPVGPQVAISGDVNTPGIFELKGKTTVGAALKDAGGMTSLADTERAVIERIEDHSSREIEEFSLDAQGQARLLRDGDLVRVFPISPKFENAVTLRGNVTQPGLYAWKEGMRISDLIPSRGFLITRNYWNMENHLVPRVPAHPFGDPRAGRGSEPQNGRPGDLNSDQDENPSSAGPRADQSGNSSAGNSSADPFQNAGTPIIDTVGHNRAEINWDYALIERLDTQDLSTRLIPFNLADAIDNPASADNHLLKAGDVVTIFSRADLELPMEKHASFVRVDGEVNAPGVYRVDPGETLRGLVKQAGGLTPLSYLYASILTRVSALQAEEKQLRQSTEQMQRELTANFANGAPLAGQTGTDPQAQLAIRENALAKLNSIKPTGRIVLDMKPGAETVADIPDFSLEDGDTFYIPPRLSTVQVIGAVYNANAFRFEPQKRLGDYLDAAGSPTREADRKRIFVIRADGTVVSRQSRNTHSHGRFENMKLLPGDAVVVPEKLHISSKMNNFLQATQFASQTALTAAALSVIK